VNKKGLTFVELLIVISILAILTVGLLMTINPMLQVNKGKDARRKKDLGRIRVAFEEYYNDRLCYPSQDLIAGLSCNSTDFLPYLNSWPCDPDGGKYEIFIDGNECPKYYRAYGKLQWEDDMQAINCDYGESSTNVDWREFPDEYETGCPSSVAVEVVDDEEEEVGEPVVDADACYRVVDGVINETPYCEWPGCYLDTNYEFPVESCTEK
jgi:prepilin-type N-terminal cleavage/methylation domain-containing protein